MPISRQQTIDLDFDGVLSVIQGWLGADVLLLAESGSPPVTISLIGGSLTAAPGITEPIDRDEFAFALDCSCFSLHRRHFRGATHYPDAYHLELAADYRSAGGLAATINILRQVL